MQYNFDLVREGKIGTPWLFNGYEQNSQWLDPWYPQYKCLFKEYPAHLEKVGMDLDSCKIEVGSLEGYGAPTIDIGLELIGSDIEKLVYEMANLVPECRRNNVDDHLERLYWDDADMWIARCKNGSLFSMQTSFVTVGNYPGITAIIYGSKGTLHAMLITDPETARSSVWNTPTAMPPRTPVCLPTLTQPPSSSVLWRFRRSTGTPAISRTMSGIPRSTAA